MIVIKYIKLYIYILCSLISVGALSQQDPIYSNYMYNMMSVNPAFTGTNESYNITAGYRKQWVGIEGAPQTFFVSFDMPANNDWLGLGLNFYHDLIGVQTTSGLLMSYAFRTHVFNDDDLFSIGIQAGVKNFRANYDRVDLIQPYDPSFYGNVVNVFMPTAGAGLYYHTGDQKFYVSFSMPDMISGSVRNKSVIIQNALSSKLVSHYFLNAGYNLELNDDIRLKPSICLKAVAGAPIQADFNTNVWFNDVFSVGLSYRTGDAVIGLLGLQISPQIGIGYSYDKTFSSLTALSAGSHEIFLRYEIFKDDNRNNRYKTFKYY
jgi:Bacteroidetes-specific putative membrane protein